MDQKKWEKRARYLNLLIFVGIMIAVSALSSIFLKDFAFQFQDDSMTITGPDKSICTVSYSGIQSIEVVESPDWGTCVDGNSSGSYRWGIWKNDVWGQYTMYTSTTADICILIRTDTQIIALSYESDEVTTGLMESLSEAIAAAKK